MSITPPQKIGTNPIRWGRVLHLVRRKRLFHGGNTGSNPVRDAKILKDLRDLTVLVLSEDHDRVTIKTVNCSLFGE
jgi:hypothetical protein